MKRLFYTGACILLLTGCVEKKPVQQESGNITGHMALEYATQFSVDYLADGCSAIHIGTDDFLLVPEGQTPPEHSGYTVIQQPVECAYVAASSAMDLFDAAGALSCVQMVSTDTPNWALPNIQAAMQAGDIFFIGKYSAPDYEAMTELGCDLAVESTMIYHSPAVREQIERMGIPVLVERSSYEQHPLGRMEWLRLYGLITGHTEEADSYFAEKTAGFREMPPCDIPQAERKTAAFFSITSNGYVTVRKPGDYISQEIELAGGRYIFTPDILGVDENALSTMNIQFETFYETARDADILIYNSTIEGQLESIAQLIEKNSLFTDFKAVQNGDVWCTVQNLFQQTTGAADMIADMRAVFIGEAGEQLTYLYRLK